MNETWKLYLQMDNITLDDNLDLNLYIVSNTCHMVITLNSQREVRSKFLVRVQIKLS